MKYIIYTIIDSGMDGRGHPRVIKAFASESERDAAYMADRNCLYRQKGECIIDHDKHYEHALRKLDGIDRFVLGV